MRRIHVVTLTLLLGLGMALPATVSARPLTILGSLTITGNNNAPLANSEITGFAVIANPGLEKTMVQQLPPYTIPVFIDGEAEDDDEATRSRPDDRPHGDDPPGHRPDGPPTSRPDGPGRPEDRPRFRLLRRNLDTTLVLTNTRRDPLTIQLTLRDAAGVVILIPDPTRTFAFRAHETMAIQVSDLLLP